MEIPRRIKLRIDDEYAVPVDVAPLACPLVTDANPGKSFAEHCRVVKLLRDDHPALLVDEAGVPRQGALFVDEAGSSCRKSFVEILWREAELRVDNHLARLDSRHNPVRLTSRNQHQGDNAHEHE